MVKVSRFADKERKTKGQENIHMFQGTVHSKMKIQSLLMHFHADGQVVL